MTKFYVKSGNLEAVLEVDEGPLHAVVAAYVRFVLGNEKKYKLGKRFFVSELGFRDHTSVCVNVKEDESYFYDGDLDKSELTLSYPVNIFVKNINEEHKKRNKRKGKNE